MAEDAILNEPTVGQRIGAKIGEHIDSAVNGYNSVSQKAQDLANKGKAVHRLNRMKFNRKKEDVKVLFAEAKQKAAEFKDKAKDKIKGGAEAVAETSFVLAFGVKELVSMGYNAAKNKINNRIDAIKEGYNRRVTNLKNKVNNVKTKFNNGVNKAKNVGKKVWKGVKTTAIVAGYVAAAPVVVPYKAVKWGYKKAKAGVNWVRNGYKNLKARALGITDEVAQNKETALKQTSSEKKISRLNAQQVSAAWEQVRDYDNAGFLSRESDSRYNMSGYADRFLDDINSGKNTITPENAELAAAFLGISMEVQDKVNHNKVVDKEERNHKIAEQLEQFGIKNPYKTEETKENESQSPTVPTEEKTQEQEAPVADKSKEQETPPVEPVSEKPKDNEIPGLTAEQEKLVGSQLGVLKILGEENGLKPNDEMYKGLVGMMEKGFEEKGITPEQMAAIREQNKELFPSKEQENQSPNQSADKSKEQPAQENTEKAEQPAPKKEETRAPDPNNSESFNFAGITGNEGVSAESEAINHSQTADKSAAQPNAAPEKSKEAEQPAPQAAPERPNEAAAKEAAEAQKQPGHENSSKEAEAKVPNKELQGKVKEVCNLIQDYSDKGHSPASVVADMVSLSYNTKDENRLACEQFKEMIKDLPAKTLPEVAAGIASAETTSEVKRDFYLKMLERDDLGIDALHTMAMYGKDFNLTGDDRTSFQKKFQDKKQQLDTAEAAGKGIVNDPERYKLHYKNGEIYNINSSIKSMGIDRQRKDYLPDMNAEKSINSVLKYGKMNFKKELEYQEQKNSKSSNESSNENDSKGNEKKLGRFLNKLRQGENTKLARQPKNNKNNTKQSGTNNKIKPLDALQKRDGFEI